MHGKRACLIVNPKDGKNVEHFSEITQVFKKAGWKAEIVLKLYGGHSRELAKQAAERGDDLIIAYGGDGTVNQVVNGIMAAKEKRKHSVLGVIPGGTANVWATELGIPNDPVQAALAIVESEPRAVDLGCVNVEHLTVEATSAEQQTKDFRTYPNQPGKKTISKARHYFLLMAGVGIDAAVMGHVSDSLKSQVGPLAVGVAAAKELPEQQPFPVEVLIPNAHRHEELFWHGESLQVVVGNTRSYANITDMTPQAYIDDGILDACVIMAADPVSTTKQVLSLLLRRHPDHVSAEFFRATHFILRVPASVPLQLDGSAMELKDYLARANRDILKRETDAASVIVDYRFDALPHTLNVAIPRTYNNALFQREKDDV